MPDTQIQQRIKIHSFREFTDQIDSAINAHGEWKIRLEKGMGEGCLSLDPASIELDHQCVLGEWLNSKEVEPYKGLHFKDIIKVHADFHKSTSEIVRTCRAGDTQTALSHLRNPESEFNNKTSELVKLLNNWKNEKNGLVSEFNDRANVTVTDSVHSKPVRKLFATIGFIMGLAFIALGWASTILQHNLPLEPNTVVQIYVLNYANYIIATAPFILMIMAFFTGRFIDKSKALNEDKLIIARQEKELKELLNRNSLLLNNIETGFILLDKNFITNIFSLSAQKILKNTELSARRVDQLFSGLVDEKTLHDINTYSELYANARHAESTLEQLNPVDIVHFHAQKGIPEKFIKVRLKRILDEQSAIIGYILIMQDITETTQAERKAEYEKNRATENSLLVDSLLQMEPDSVLSFQRSIISDMEEANSLIKNAKKESYESILMKLFRIVHTVKGTSALFGFNSIAAHAHQYEESIKKLQKLQNIKALDFLTLTVNQVKILEELRKIEQLIEKFKSFASGKESHILRRNLERYKNQLVQQSDLSFYLNLEEFTDSAIPIEHIKEWTDIFSQLMRNSIAHGIENSDERKSFGKPESGEISIKSHTGEKGYWVTYRDDGRSFDIEKIKERAIKQNLRTNDEINNMNESDIIELIFEPGFSTNEIADMNSGRGMGMDILREIMTRLHGKIRIRWQKKKYSEFEFQISK